VEKADEQYMRTFSSKELHATMFGRVAKKTTEVREKLIQLMKNWPEADPALEEKQ
jgi:hypothetical protein